SEIRWGRQPTGDRGCRGYHRRDEVRTAARPLASLEVAVRRRRAAFAGRERVGVHAEAHRAAASTPLRPGSTEYVVEPFGLGAMRDFGRARYDENTNTVGDPSPAEHVGGGAQ